MKVRVNRRQLEHVSVLTGLGYALDESGTDKDECFSEVLNGGKRERCWCDRIACERLI